MLVRLRSCRNRFLPEGIAFEIFNLVIDVVELPAFGLLLVKNDISLAVVLIASNVLVIACANKGNIVRVLAFRGRIVTVGGRDIAKINDIRLVSSRF